MTDVSFCEDGVGMERERLFYLLRNERASPAPPPAFSPYPSGGDPSPPAHPEGLHSTNSSRPHTAHTPGRWTRCTGLHPIPDRPRQADRNGGGRWTACNPSIMCIMIALSQAWYIDSRLYKYHTNILLHLVIVNYYLSIDIPLY